jgi:hypothetical protein
MPPPYDFLLTNADATYTYRSDAPSDLWLSLNSIRENPRLALRVTVLQLTLEFDDAGDSGVFKFIKDQAMLVDTTPFTAEVRSIHLRRTVMMLMSGRTTRVTSRSRMRPQR